MIELIPAIDIIGGQCVRLRKGDYEQKTVYGEDPCQIALQLEEAGFRRLHMVDLDGAKAHHTVNIGILKAIKEQTRLTVDFGGGLKTDHDVELAFDYGADMVTVGSVAVTQPEMFCGWIERFGAARIILGADVSEGKIRINGWKQGTDQDLLSFLRFYVDRGISRVLCTDISRDGMLSGPAIGLYKEIMEAFPSLHLIASGGVSGNADIHQLAAAGIPAVVFGKALYEGKIDIDKLMQHHG